MSQIRRLMLVVAICPLVLFGLAIDFVLIARGVYLFNLEGSVLIATGCVPIVLGCILLLIPRWRHAGLARKVGIFAVACLQFAALIMAAATSL